MAKDGKDVGYIRVSSVDQNLARQLDGVELDKVFEDKASGGTTKRPGLTACLDYLREGDVLHVHSIDRLARNVEDLLRLVRELTDRGVEVRFHKEALTFRPGGEGDFAGRLMLQVMGAIAEFERAMIRERQREGIAKARREGRHCGRPRTITPATEEDILARRREGQSCRAIARALGISASAVSKVVRRRAQEDGEGERQ